MPHYKRHKPALPCKTLFSFPLTKIHQLCCPFVQNNKLPKLTALILNLPQVPAAPTNSNPERSQHLSLQAPTCSPKPPIVASVIAPPIWLPTLIHCPTTTVIFNPQPCVQQYDFWISKGHLGLQEKQHRSFKLRHLTKINREVWRQRKKRMQCYISLNYRSLDITEDS